MSSSRITIWMGNDIPAEFRTIIGLPEFIMPSEIPSAAPEVDRAAIVYVAHVPASVLANPVYKRGNWEGEHSGWLRDAELGLFGTNALDVYPHPEGNGIVVVGSAM